MTRASALVALLCMHGCSCRQGVGDAGVDARADRFVDAAVQRIVDLDTAAANNCVVLVDGRVVCWGPSLPPGVDALAADVEQVTVGQAEVCVRRGTSVECLGRPLEPSNPLLAPPTRDFVDVSANSDRACALTTDRQLVCWGLSPLGMLVPAADELRVGASGGACVRDGTNASCWFPGESTVRPLPGAIARLAAPNLWARCGLDQAGIVACDPTCVFATSSPELCPMEDWSTAVGQGPGGAFVQVELPEARSFMCALRATGEIACWGTDYDAPTGPLGPSLRDLEPSGLRFRDIGVGDGHVCGVTIDDRVVCWGSAEAVDVPAEFR